MRVMQEIEEIIGIEAEDAVLRQRQDRRGRAGAARGDHPAHPAAQGRSAPRRCRR